MNRAAEKSGCGTRVDVIIPVCRPDGKLARLLEMLAEQTCKPRKIYLIHTKTKDSHIEPYPKKYDNVFVLEIKPEEFDHGGTRRLGAKLSDAEFLLYMTQDAVPRDERLVERLLECFADEKVGACYARQLPAPDCGAVERYTRGFNYPDESCVKSRADMERLGIKTFFCSNVCAMYRRSIYEEQGGFVPRVIFNEDMILAGTMIKSGFKIAYCAEAQVIHSHNYTGGQQFRRNFDLAVSQKEHPEIFQGVSSESEGVRLVLSTAKYLVHTGNAGKVGHLLVSSGCKFLGYRMGTCYRKLPDWLIQKCTMNRRYWQKDKKENKI